MRHCLIFFVRMLWVSVLVSHGQAMAVTPLANPTATLSSIDVPLITPSPSLIDAAFLKNASEPAARNHATKCDVYDGCLPPRNDGIYLETGASLFVVPAILAVLCVNWS